MLTVALGQIVLENPILSASGTFGTGWEAHTFADLSRVGGLVSKTVTKRPRPGNPPPRIVETASGMLNSIGLENRGIDVFLAEQLPRMKSLRRPGTSTPRIFVNLGGESLGEFVELAERVSTAGIDAIELNLSCPNVQEGKLLFSTDPRMTEDAVRRVKAVTSLPVFAKVSPNVTRVADIARAAEQGGADGITAINTPIGMAVDWKRRKPVLGRSIGGLSGPAIKPIALRMVWEIARAVRVPILGVGGIATATDVLEFLVAGASAVQIGTQSFVDPGVHVRVLEELEGLVRQERTTVRELIGTLRTEGEPVAGKQSDHLHGGRQGVNR